MNLAWKTLTRAFIVVSCSLRFEFASVGHTCGHAQEPIEAWQERAS